MAKDKNTSAVTEDTVKEWQEKFQEYQRGKQMIDTKATTNQEWWRIRHWEQMNSKEEEEEKATSAWLFNSIINKHADIMDNFPKPNILPREANDEEEARTLSDILPVILERNNYEDVYSDKAYDLLVDGATVTSVLWDNSLNNGMGDIAVKQVDVHNIFWEPGINEIQDSAMIFTTKLVDSEALEKQYPQMEGKSGGGRSTKEYIHDENIDTSSMTEVIDVYYKKTIVVTVAEDGRTGAKAVKPKQILHFAKMANGVLLFASENEQGYREAGWYEHGKYPFVVTRLFPIKDSPWGFGYVDVMKSPQAQIDRLNQLVLKNAVTSGTSRWAVKEGADIDLDEFADWSKPFIKVSTSAALDDVMKDISTKPVPAFIVNHVMNLIDQLKETSGNRDISQGGTQGGVTAATAIAAMQEAGSKLSRDTNRALYRGKREEDYLAVELVRQFYSEPRSFRIDNSDGSYQFVEYSNTNIAPAEGRRAAMFDIKITAEKQSPFSRAAQNETAKEMYGMGLFAPQNAEPSLVCLDMMEFEGKEKIKQEVKENSIFLQQFQAMQQAIIQYLPPLAVQMGLLDPKELQQTAPSNTPEGTAEERAAKTEVDSTRTAKARVSAAKRAQVG